MSGISLKETVSGDVPTPGTDKVTFFFNGTTWVYKDDAGAVHNLGVAGVTSVNTLMGDVSLVAGSNITITPLTGNAIEISASGGGGVSAVNAGDGIAVTPLTGGAVEVAANLVAGSNVTVTPVTGGALEISADIGVEEINGMTGSVSLVVGDGLQIDALTGNTLMLGANLVAGANVTITPVTGGALEISATGGGGGISSVVAGDGIAVTPLTGDAVEVAANLVAGSNITLTPVTGGALEISASGGGGGISYTFAATPPGSPTPGDLWFDSAGGVLYIWVDDGVTSQWIEV